MPWWYLLIRAARYLGMDPEVLAQKSVVWQDWALMAQAADHNIEAELIRRARQEASMN